MSLFEREIRAVNVVFGEKEEVEKKLALDLASAMVTLGQHYPTGPILFGAPGGRTVSALKGLAAAELPSDLTSRLHFYGIDGFNPEEARQDDNHAAAEKAFLSELVRASVIRRSNVHILSFNPWEADTHLRIANELVADLGGFKLIFLGTGGGMFNAEVEDTGHVAGIMPGYWKLWSNADTFTGYRQNLKPSWDRLTITPQAIARTPAVFAATFGDAKRNVVEHFVSGNLDKVAQPLRVIEEPGEGQLVRAFYTDQVEPFGS